MAKLSGYI